METNDVALIDPRRLTPADVERERREGYPNLSVFHRQIAIDFVTGGDTIKSIASRHELEPRHVLAMFGLPLLRAFIADLQREYMAHRLIDGAWVETQIIKNMPKLEGEEPVPCVTREGDEVMRCKYHSKELMTLFKHFGGNADQKKQGGFHVTIDFGAMGVRMDAEPEGTVIDVP